MGAFQYLSRLHLDLVEKARLYGYPESSICILEGDEKRLQSKYAEIFLNLNSCKHNRESRTVLEYGQDLVSSWLFEFVTVTFTV